MSGADRNRRLRAGSAGLYGTAGLDSQASIRLRAKVLDLRRDAPRRNRLASWLPLMLVCGGFSLSGLPSFDPALNAVLVGLYLGYTSLITGLHILPYLAAKLD